MQLLWRGNFSFFLRIKLKKPFQSFFKSMMRIRICWRRRVFASHFKILQTFKEQAWPLEGFAKKWLARIGAQLYTQQETSSCFKNVSCKISCNLEVGRAGERTSFFNTCWNGAKALLYPIPSFSDSSEEACPETQNDGAWHISSSSRLPHWMVTQFQGKGRRSWNAFPLKTLSLYPFHGSQPGRDHILSTMISSQIGFMIITTKPIQNEDRKHCFSIQFY